MTTMIYNLPRDLIEDIISRVPLKFMKAVRLTCKSWNDLSKSESFSKMHIGKSTRKGESMMIAMMPHNLYLMSGVVDDVDPSIEHKGQTRWINLRFSHRPHRWDWFNYALGYEDKESRRGIKLLSHSVSLKGNTYWSATERSSEEKIAALFHHHDKYDTEFEIWITTKIEVEMVTWSKFLRMDTGPKIGFPDTFFIDEEKKVFMDCGTHYDSDDHYRRFIDIIGEAGYLRKLDPGVPADKNCRPDVCSYVPSLSQIKKPARGKRIEQSSLEKRLFDQNMLRLAAVEKIMETQYGYCNDAGAKEFLGNEATEIQNSALKSRLVRIREILD
ncbi:unnamed protein product [Arabidopsis lyrata]|nr:unnamed protein product [Arabidopsis lyrata]